MSAALRLPDGRRLAWREKGSGPALVLVHGWAMSSAVFAEALEALCGEFRVLAPDLRGHGASDAGDVHDLHGLASDLCWWAEALDLREMTLGGWSLGGQVALCAFGALRSRIRRLILVGTTPRFTAEEGWSHGLPATQVRAMSRDLKRRYEKTMGDFFALQFAGEEMAGERYRELLRFAVRGGRLPEPEVALAALDTLRQADLREDLSTVTCPALVIHGDLDRIIPLEAGRHLAEHLPEGRLRIMTGAGHTPFLSRPGETFQLWREFSA